MTESAAAESDPTLQLLKKLQVVVKEKKSTLDSLAKTISETVNGDKAAYDELKKLTPCHTMTPAVMERSRFEDVVKELVWRRITAAQTT